MSLINKKNRPRRPPKRVKVGCPFCWEWLPAPREILEVFSGEGCLGGRCECGAVFVIDEVGRLGGQALMDAQALLCDGDLDRAVKLDSKTDFEVKTRAYMATSKRFGNRFQQQGPTQPKVWALRRIEKK